ncbi:MAG: alpha-amylase family glycosyl hydrolase [Desulfobacterales bacterium]|nr:alpha-amylase family glycosyl hydrolase [Desulfobacterales bacterium]
MKDIDTIQHILKNIYGAKAGNLAFEKIAALIDRFPVKKGLGKGYFSEEDVFLITYGDTLNKKGELPLKTLYQFAMSQFKNVFSTVHILPFFPFSSDDGFSVIDFFAVNPELGDWKDIQRLGSEFQLMFDLVLNHVSAKSTWFQNYLKEKTDYKEFAIEVDPSIDLSMVTRPRSLPLLTRFNKTSDEVVHVWTTFSSDQIDLNYKSLHVLEKMIEALLFYVEQGATSIRLDAIAYLWKEIGTTCIHLKQAHQLVQLFRKILDVVAPDVLLISETNVPHHENMSYFGDGRNEAQMIYNFTLPPLLFYSFVREDSTVLSEWAKCLRVNSPHNTFFNFTASHDGIGVRPLEGILPRSEIDSLIDIVQENGGSVSYKRNPDGSQSPYELNITYVDALLNPESKIDLWHIPKFLASQAIQFVLPGVPASYIHSVLGSRNWKMGLRQTQRARTINREKLQVDEVLSQLKDPETFRSRIFNDYIKMIKTRKRQSAFHPNADFEILEIDPKAFVIARYAKDQIIYAVTNISSKEIVVSLSGARAPLWMNDLITGVNFRTDALKLNPYQFLWLSTMDR